MAHQVYRDKGMEGSPPIAERGVDAVPEGVGIVATEVNADGQHGVVLQRLHVVPLAEHFV